MSQPVERQAQNTPIERIKLHGAPFGLRVFKQVTRELSDRPKSGEAAVCIVAQEGIVDAEDGCGRQVNRRNIFIITIICGQQKIARVSSTEAHAQIS
jgi:hypothetical protein